MSMMQEFKTFAMRGNVVDLAVGVIIGGSFGLIVGSLVNDVIMPPIGLALGGMDFTSLTITLKEATATVPAVEIKYGKFINAVINFIIVAFAIFMLVKAMNSMKKKEEAAAPPPPTKQEVLLGEIRDLLKTR